MKFILNIFSSLLLFTGASMLHAQDVPTTKTSEQNTSILEEKTTAWNPKFNFSIDNATDYISDGFVKNPDPISKTKIEMSIQDFYVSWCGYYDWTNFRDKPKYDDSRKNAFEEYQYCVGYRHTIKDGAGFADLIIDISATYKDYPTMSHDNADNDHDEEESLIIGLGNMLNSERHSLTAEHRFDYNSASNMTYGQFDTSYSYKLCKDLKLKLSGSLYWGAPRKMRSQAGSDRGWGIRSLTGKIALDYKLAQGFSISPYIGAAYLPDPAVQEHTRSKSYDNSSTYGGIKLTYKF